MTPDPDREHALRERVQALLADAPEPDTARLAAGLQMARRANRRRQRGRRMLAWLAFAVLLGAGAATAGWWLGGAAPGGGERAPSTPKHASDPERKSDTGTSEERGAGSGGTDNGLIYQGVE